MSSSLYKLVFFGSSEFSVHVLNELKLHNILPQLIVTTPDKPKGRKLSMTPNSCKLWAKEHNIEILEPASLKRDIETIISKLQSLNSNLFLVASYGKIIPKEIFEIPKRKTLNIHPSLLPKYRGASPIQSQILNDEKNVGVSVMQIEERMDSGPLISKKIITIENWPIGRIELEKTLAIEGARLFAHFLPEWLMGVISPIIQNESEATYCQKIKKRDGEIQIDFDDLSKNAYKNILKIKAYEKWPKTFFFDNKKRIIIEEAFLNKDKINITKVTPEGKKTMLFEDYLKGKK
jgi:methionyl-tRNA formyltransferase